MVPAHVVVNTPVTIKISMESGDDVTLYCDTGTGAALLQKPRQGQSVAKSLIVVILVDFIVSVHHYAVCLGELLCALDRTNKTHIVKHVMRRI